MSNRALTRILPGIHLTYLIGILAGIHLNYFTEILPGIPKTEPYEQASFTHAQTVVHAKDDQGFSTKVHFFAYLPTQKSNTFSTDSPRTAQGRDHLHHGDTSSRDELGGPPSRQLHRLAKTRPCRLAQDSTLSSPPATQPPVHLRVLSHE